MINDAQPWYEYGKYTPWNMDTDGTRILNENKLSRYGYVTCFKLSRSNKG